MTSSARRALLALFVAALLFPILYSHAEAPMATEPEECVFLAAPLYNGLDCMPEENLFLISNQDGIRAFDIRTGAQRWHYPQGANVEWGGRQVVGWKSQNQLFLLDKASGRELWSRKEDGYGPIAKALLSPHAKRILAVFDSEPGKISSRLTTVLYDVQSRGQTVLGDTKNAFPMSFSSDGKTALFSKIIFPPAATSTDQWQGCPNEFFLMDLDNGAISGAHAVTDIPRGALSASGLFTTICFRNDGPFRLKVFDAKTGALVRDLGEIPERFRTATWSADEKCLYFATIDGQKACVLDAQTGAVQQTLSRPGHMLQRVRIQRPDEGPDMVLSQDEDRNVWLWTPTPDATPTKVFDGRRFAPGDWGLQLQDGGCVSARRRQSGPASLSAYLIEGMQKLGDWRLPGQQVYMGDLFNRTMTHCVIRNFGGQGKPESNSVEVYAKDSESPLFSGRGDPLALSPDGRYFVVQIAGKRAVLLDLQEKRTVHTFDAQSDWDTQVYAAFSDDGKRVAVNAWPELEVIDLAGDFPRRGMAPVDGRRGIDCSQDKWHYGGGQSLCFSPDGTLLLSGGYGRAWLHDAGTGRPLHTFVESRHFYEAQRYRGGGFMSSLEQSARDWAGLVTDRYKSTGPVYVAFGGSGDRVVTHAAGQIIRVWDSRSGDLINVIETGLPEKRNQNWQISNRILLSENGDYALALNRDNFAPASLWSLADGTLIRRYKFPKSNFPDSNSPGIALSEDGKSVYVLDNGDLYRWPGRPKDAP